MSKPLILVPLDGSLHARAALPVAKALGEAMGASLRVIHVSGQTLPPLSELAKQLGLESAGTPWLEHRCLYRRAVGRDH